jgi:hypothetical protein
MHHPMMSMAEKDKVVEIGGSAMDPMHDMMRITP